MHPYLIAALFIIAKIWKQLKCSSTDEWMDKKKEEWNPAICDNDRPWRYHAKCNTSDGERQIPHDFTHVWNLRNFLKRANKIKLK